MEAMNIKIVGIGAGGSNLVHFLGQFLNFHAKDSVVTLIDGDTFESRNFQNQRFRRIGNKAEIKKAELREEFENVRFRSMPEYVDEDNVAELIEDGDIIFMGVDNHKTRSLINAHCRTLEDIVLISGGLEDIDGDISIYIRRNSRDVTPDLTYRHPEIAEPEDAAPFEEDCEEAMASDPARLFTVLSVVDWMMATFANYLEGRIDFYEIYIDTATCRVRKVPIPDEFKDNKRK